MPTDVTTTMRELRGFSEGSYHSISRLGAGVTEILELLEHRERPAVPEPALVQPREPAPLTPSPATALKTLEGGIWRCRPGTNGSSVRLFTSHLFESYGLDFLLLSATSRYIEDLRRVAGAQLLWCSGWPGSDSVAIMVKDGIRVSHRTSLRCKQGWAIDEDHRHAPRTVVLANVEWLRVASVYAPPGCTWQNGSIQGADEAMSVYGEWSCALSASMRAHFRDHPEQPVLYGGTWGATSVDRGEFTPSWMAAAAQVGRGAGFRSNGYTIDHIWSRKLAVDHYVRRRTAGSGGQAHTFTVMTKGG